MSKNLKLISFNEVIKEFDPVLGMEVHVELGTESKMFCACSTKFGAPTNTQVCPVCLGMPGALPVINKKALEYGIKIGLALNCDISQKSEFARKNYFYPDQPKNYQISQFDKPIAFEGYLDVPFEGEVFRVDIERAHLEEDTGKATHIGKTGRIQGADYSLLDFNRAGVPLLEIVTKPIEVPAEKAPNLAKAYVGALRELIYNLQVSDVRMDQGSLRCDVNLSLKPKGQKEFGIRTETKNVNSLKSVAKSVEYEMRRQATELLNGNQIIQETRHFQESDGTTLAGRKKESSDDYRYFPDPDLPIIKPDTVWVNTIKATIPEYPWLKYERLQKEWSVSSIIMRDLINLGAVELIEQTIAEGADVNTARSWWSSYLAQQANKKNIELIDLGISPVQVFKVIKLIDNKIINKEIGQKVLDLILEGQGDDPNVIVEKNNLKIEIDSSKLEEIINFSLEKNPDIVESIKQGKMAAMGRIIGEVKKATKGQADPKEINELVMKQINK